MAVRQQRFYEFGPLRLNPAERLLERDGQPISLTPKVFDTLRVLIEHAGHLVAKDDLMRMVWPDATVEEANLAQNISVLRKTLGTAPDGREYIETVPKHGYRFIAKVREVERNVDAPMESPAEGAAPLVPLSPARKPRRWIPALTLVVASLVIGAGVWYRARAKNDLGERRVMLAVLPFENLSGNPEQEYFSNGLTEEMITQLGRLEPERLGVIARTSAMQYKNGRKDTRQIASELGVDYILEGSVRREGDRVRVTAQLIQARDQSHLWAEDYDRDLRDILGLQSEVAGAIAQQIRVKLTPQQHARLGHAAPVNTEAYENYLKGRFFWNKRTVEGHQKAIDFFEQALALDPNYEQAYAGLADAYALLGSWPNAVLPRRDAMTRAREAAQKALAFDESLADAHASLGFVKMHYDWDFSGAEREFLRAIALNPGYATAHHWYAYDLVALGRLDEAVAEIRRAQKADPLSVIISRDVGELLLFAGHDDEAIAQSRKTLEMDPYFSGANWVLAWAHHHQGKEKAFCEDLQKALSGDDPAAGLYYACTGNTQEARRAVAKLQEDATKRFGSSRFVAEIDAQLGDPDGAFAWLEKTFEEREGALIMMRVDPTLERIRSDPRFEQLARRVGLH
jgi:TolB-like protein/DNA-binding winged helix-turn-helix (wHTH) protein/Tfp pilus assembly protein PilF